MIDESILDAVIDAGTPQTYPRNGYLARQGEPGDQLLLIRRGHVKVVVAAAGGNALLAVRGPGDLVGEFAVVSGGRRSASVVALEPVLAYTLANATFRTLLERTPSAAVPFIRSLVDKLQESDRRRLDFSTAGMHQRVARVLVDLIDGPFRHESGAAAIPLSQQDLADAVGASRSACAKAVQRLRDTGVVAAAHPRGLVVLDPGRLRALAV